MKWKQQHRLSMNGEGGHEEDLECPEVPQCDVFVSTEKNEKMLQEVTQVVKFARPDWDHDKVSVKTLTGGTTNTLLNCEHGPSGEKMLIRIYGEKTELFIDRLAEVRNMLLLNQHGLAPKVYCAFTNGLCYGYYPGNVLDKDLVMEPSLTLKIARHMARMHAIPINTKAKAKIVPMLEHYLSLVPDKIREKAEKTLAEEFSMSTVSLKDEINRVKKEYATLDNAVVFCHNDLLSKNILLDGEQIYFIDYEYASANFQAFDIGNFFCEFGGQEGYDRGRYPTKEWQLNWIRVYLEEYERLKGTMDHVSEEKVHKLYVDVNKFSLASLLLWGLWALIQAAHSAIHFDFVNFATERLGMYFAKKAEFLAL